MVSPLHLVPAEKAYSDPRDPPIRDIYTQMPREEQERRIEAIERIGYLVQDYGTDQVREWALSIVGPIGALVEEYGVETVMRWIRYHGIKEGRP